MTATIGIISSGRGENLRYILLAERDGYLPAQVKIVLADQPDAGALRIAQEFGVRHMYLDPAGRSREEYDQQLVSHLEGAGVDLVVLTGYMRILSPRFVRHYKNRILNIHPALLPSFRGLDAFSQALEHGVMWTGTTIHLVDTHESLKARIQRAEYRAYPRAIKMFIEGNPEVVGRKIVFENGAK